jgi:hypothetical protein
MAEDENPIRVWRREGLSYAEIGRRLGVSPERLRDLVDDHTPDEGEDDEPDSAPVR